MIKLRNELDSKDDNNNTQSRYLEKCYLHDSIFYIVENYYNTTDFSFSFHEYENAVLFMFHFLSSQRMKSQRGFTEFYIYI